MTHSVLFRVRRSLALVPALAILAGACKDDRGTVFEPVGEPGYDIAPAPEVARLPAGTVGLTAGANPIVTVTAANLPALTGGASYRFWAVQVDTMTGLATTVPAAGDIAEFFMRDSLSGGTTGDPVIDPVTGEDTLRVVDSTIVAAVGSEVSSYAGTNDRRVFSIRIRLDSANAANVATGVVPFRGHAVVVSREDAATGTAPSDAQFLWRRIGVGGAGTLSFGTFGGADLISTVSPNDYVYVPAGAALGAFRGPELSVDLQEVSRPPVGFFYAGWLIGDPAARAGFVDTVMVDTLRSAYSPVASQSRVSLFDADVNPLLPGIGPRAIIRAQIRNCAAGSNTNNCQNTLATSGTAALPFGPYRRFIITLEPKGSANGVLGTSRLLGADVRAEVQATP